MRKGSLLLLIFVAAALAWIAYRYFSLHQAPLPNFHW